jgi:cobalt-precorrin 5A hydrolase
MVWFGFRHVKAREALCTSIQGGSIVAEVIILASSPRGLDLGRRLRAGLGAGALVDASSDTERAVQKALRQERSLICVLPAETIVRALAPVLASYGTSPPVAWVDEGGRYVLGLAGKAGPLCRQVASSLGATILEAPTADRLAGPDVRLIGQRWGWRLDQVSDIDAVAAAIRSGERVGVYQDAGQRVWWQSFGEWPHHFERLSAWPPRERFAALLVVSDRLLERPDGPIAERMVLYRPQTLTLGVSCRRGVTADEVADCCERLFAAHNLSTLSLTAVGTAASNKGEEGLAGFAEQRAVPLLPYPPDKLALLQRTKRLGVASRCEPAAMLSAGVSALTVPKPLFRRVALAVARRSVG